MDFLIVADGAFNLTGIEADWYGTQSKVYTRKELCFLSNLARDTEEWIEQPTFGEAGQPDTFWNVTPTTASDGCYPLGVPNLDFTYDNDAQDKSVAIQFGYDFYRITIPDPKYSEINRFKGVNQDTFISVMKQSVEKVPNTEDFYDSPGYNSDDNKKTNDGSRSYTARANILSRPGANGTLKGTVGQDSFGDVAWYLAVSAHALGYDLESIMQMNVDKLRKRYPDGFKPELSKNRKEGDV